MSTHYLKTYLNDHLAGSAVALELLAHLEQSQSDPAIKHFATELISDITADRKVLEGLMAQAQVGVSQVRKVGAWLTEKLSELKLRLDDPKFGPLRLLEICEALSLGIEGKRSLWKALVSVAEAVPALRGPAYDHLQERANEQRQRVEVVRLQAAREALQPDREL